MHFILFTETTLDTDTTALTTTESISSTVTKEYLYSTVKTATPKKSTKISKQTVMLP